MASMTLLREAFRYGMGARSRAAARGPFGMGVIPNWKETLGERWETSANGLLGCFFYTLAR